MAAAGATTTPAAATAAAIAAASVADTPAGTSATDSPNASTAAKPRSPPRRIGPLRQVGAGRPRRGGKRGYHRRLPGRPAAVRSVPKRGRPPSDGTDQRILRHGSLQCGAIRKGQAHPVRRGRRHHATARPWRMREAPAANVIAAAGTPANAADPTTHATVATATTTAAAATDANTACVNAVAAVAANVAPCGSRAGPWGARQHPSTNRPPALRLVLVWVIAADTETRCRVNPSRRRVGRPAEGPCAQRIAADERATSVAAAAHKASRSAHHTFLVGTRRIPKHCPVAATAAAATDAAAAATTTTVAAEERSDK